MKPSEGKRSILRLLRRKKALRASPDIGSQGIGELEAQIPNPFCSTLGPDRRWEIISSYGRVLEKCSSPIEKESSLPFSKGLIRQAIYEELIENPVDELRSHLEIAFVQLEAFLPPTDFKVIEEFKQASSLAQKMASSGNPNSIIASARILKQAKGDTAVKIQEDISEKMKKRLKQIRSIGASTFSMAACQASDSA